MFRKKSSLNNSKKLGCLSKLIIILVVTIVAIWALDLYVRILTEKPNTSVDVHLSNQLDFVKESIWLLKHGGSISVQDGIITDARGETLSPSELPPNLYKQFQSQFTQPQINTLTETICQKPANLSATDWQNLTLKYTLIHHPSGKREEVPSIEIIAVSPNNQLLVSYSRRDNLLKFWDVSTGKLIKSMFANQDTLSQILFTPDGQNLIMSSLDGTIHFYDPQTIKIKKVLEHSSGVDNINISQDGKILVSLLKENLRRKLIIWDLTTGNKINTLTTKSSIDNFYVSKDNKLIVLTGEHHLEIQELATGKIKGFFRFGDRVNQITRGNFYNMLISSQANFIISSGYKEDTVITPVINIWDLNQLPENNSDINPLNLEVLLSPPLATIPFYFPNFSNNSSLGSLDITDDSQWAISTGSNTAIFGVNLCTEEKIEAGIHFASLAKIFPNQNFIVTAGVTPTSYDTHRSDLKIWQFEP